MDTFTLFPKLPTELQLKIWKYALPIPGIMQVYCIYPASTRSPELLKNKDATLKLLLPVLKSSKS
jgi:hypothetical protein